MDLTQITSFRKDQLNPTTTVVRTDGPITGQPQSDPRLIKPVHGEDKTEYYDEPNLLRSKVRPPKFPSHQNFDVIII